MPTIYHTNSLYSLLQTTTHLYKLKEKKWLCTAHRRKHSSDELPLPKLRRWSPSTSPQPNTS